MNTNSQERSMAQSRQRCPCVQLSSSFVSIRVHSWFDRLFLYEANTCRTISSELRHKPHHSQGQVGWGTSPFACCLVGKNQVEPGSGPGPLVGPYNLQAGEWSEFRFRVTRQGK